MPQGLDAVIECAVAKDPAERYASAGELIEAARERQGRALAATRVLSARPEGPTVPLGEGPPERHPGLSRWRRPIAAGLLVWFLSGTGALALAIVSAVLLLAGDGDMVAVAKTLNDTAKRTRTLSIKGGILQGAPLAADQVVELLEFTAEPSYAASMLSMFVRFHRTPDDLDDQIADLEGVRRRVFVEGG